MTGRGYEGVDGASRSRLRALGETVVVFGLLCAPMVPMLYGPPDPFTQVRYLVVSLAAAVGGAVVLVYGLGYDRIRVTWDALLIWVTVLAGAGIARSAVGSSLSPFALAVKALALLGGLAAGVWLVYHDGVARLRTRAG